MIVVINLDPRDLRKLLKLARRGRLRVVMVLAVVAVSDPGALGGFLANSNSRIVREPIILKLPSPEV